MIKIIICEIERQLESPDDDVSRESGERGGGGMVTRVKGEGDGVGDEETLEEAKVV